MAGKIPHVPVIAASPCLLLALLQTNLAPAASPWGCFRLELCTSRISTEPQGLVFGKGKKGLEPVRGWEMWKGRRWTSGWCWVWFLEVNAASPSCWWGWSPPPIPLEQIPNSLDRPVDPNWDQTLSPTAANSSHSFGQSDQPGVESLRRTESFFSLSIAS